MMLGIRYAVPTRFQVDKLGVREARGCTRVMTKTKRTSRPSNIM